MTLTEAQRRNLAVIANHAGWITSGQYFTRINTLWSLEKLGLAEVKMSMAYSGSCYQVRITDRGRKVADELGLIEKVRLR